MILYPEALEVWFTLLTKVIENGYLPKADFPYMFPVNHVIHERRFFRETHLVKQKLDWIVVLFLTPGFLRTFNMLICTVTLQNETLCSFPKHNWPTDPLVVKVS